MDILVVDDDVNISKLMRLYLEKEGYSVECCYRGDEAVEMAAMAHPRLMILDIMLRSAGRFARPATCPSSW